MKGIRKAVLSAVVFAFLFIPLYAEPPHLNLARSVAGGVLPESNLYSHGPGQIIWGEDGKHNTSDRTDCSSFLNLVFMKAYQLKVKDLLSWMQTVRPKAKDWHDAIAKEDHFSRVLRLKDLKPGDVIAIKYPLGLGNTGHVMIVAETPKKIPASKPTRTGTEQWEVHVIDSTSKPHGATDSRVMSATEMDTGVGQGTIRVYTDSKNKIIGYAWGLDSTFPFHSAAEYLFEIGRYHVEP